MWLIQTPTTVQLAGDSYLTQHKEAVTSLDLLDKYLKGHFSLIRK